MSGVEHFSNASGKPIPLPVPRKHLHPFTVPLGLVLRALLAVCWGLRGCGGGRGRKLRCPWVAGRPLRAPGDVLHLGAQGMDVLLELAERTGPRAHAALLATSCRELRPAAVELVPQGRERARLPIASVWR